MTASPEAATVGWYVHHHGAGHLHRFLAVRERLGPGVVGLGSLPRPASVPPEGWVELPGDVGDGPPDDPTAGGVLHWVPRGVPGLRARTARIASWAAAADPAVLVVDVSVEVALLGRLLSLPTVLIAQRGRRTDAPHLAAYAGASAVLAPWTAATHAPGDGPPEDRLVLCGAVSRFDGRPAAEAPHDGSDRAPVGSGGPAAPSSVPAPAPGSGSGRRSGAGPASGRRSGAEPASGWRSGAEPASGWRSGAAGSGPRRVLLLVGAGGHALEAADVVAAAAATPGTTWHVAGALRVPPAPGTVDHGASADVRALIDAADVVVGTAGGNVVAEVAARRRPLILLPQERPFDEQRRQAELLADAGLVTTLPSWPAAGAWPGLLCDAAARPVGRWAVHHDGRGAQRMADVIRAVAHGRPADDARAGDDARPDDGRPATIAGHAGADALAGPAGRAAPETPGRAHPVPCA